MFNRRDVIYSYDGTFEGFLCCVYESYMRKETPADIYNAQSLQPGLLPAVNIAANPKHAKRVWASIPVKMGKNAPLFLQYAFLTALPQKELAMLEFMYLAYQKGPRALSMLAHPGVNKLNKAVQQMTHEAHLYSGFVRFSVCKDGLMAASIKPKSFVLPLLGEHFAGRFPNQRFLIYDETHRQLCVYSAGRFWLNEVCDFKMPEPDESEQAYRKLWRMFYDTIAVKGRENYNCRLSLMPKRYWNRMTEFAYGGKALHADIDSAGSISESINDCIAKPVLISPPKN